MAMGKRPAARQASPMWVDTADLPTSDGHPYFERLNRVLADSGFDAFVEELCASFYADRLGRPSLRPGRYFRMLFIGYFEGLSSERGFAWRVAGSLSLRSFLDLELTAAAPDHSTLSRTRRRIDVETHEAVFTWVLERLSAAGLVRGKTVGIDATTLEANAAMRSIERRDTGESHEAFIRRLAEASGVETPTRADLARFDRSRKNKKTSNKEWKSPQDVAYKAETNFVDVVPQQSRLRLSLNMHFHELHDPKKLAKDVTNLGRWGNGDVEVGLSAAEDMPYVMGLVQQAFEKQMADAEGQSVIFSSARPLSGTR